LRVTEALVIEEVTKRFGEFTAVDGFSLRLARGEVLGFLGPNGAGKTTTLRMVMSIIYPDSGRITVLGGPRAAEMKDRIGYLPEERGLYRKMTVQETLAYFGRLKGMRGQRLRERIDEVLERIGLEDWRYKKVETLSKGMSQKLQFVTAVLQEPELVILDEPFSGLDPLNIDVLERLIGEMRQRGTTVVFSTHQMNQAERLCDRVVLINRGRKVIEGTVNEVRARFDTRIALVDGVGDLRALEDLPGVARARFTSGHARLELDADADANAILERILGVVRVARFEIVRPDLQEVFVRLVSGNASSGGMQPAALAGREEEHGG
jgi:ABC-2 type transport system ATP-binding protein